MIQILKRLACLASDPAFLAAAFYGLGVGSAVLAVLLIIGELSPV